jgi:anti-sigma regulatory factor (Ser/Thr protein kinase)
MSTDTLRHSVFVYDSDDELASRMVPFLAAGLDADELVAIVAAPPHRALLEDALGDGSDDVAFFDPLEHYTRPEAALAGYDAALRRVVAGGAKTIRMFAEMPFDFRDEALPGDRWMAYEAIFNRAFAHHPLWLACSYDRQTTPEPIVETLLRTHPEIFDDGRRRPRPSEHYTDAASVVRDLTPAPRPLPELAELELVEDPLRLRRMLAATMRNAGVADTAASDLLVATGEIVANARRHGGGLRRIRAGRVNGHFVCELSDGGPGHDDPLAGFTPPRDSASRAGLWIARQLSDDVELISDPGGLTARLWASAG